MKPLLVDGCACWLVSEWISAKLIHCAKTTLYSCCNRLEVLLCRSNGKQRRASEARGRGEEELSCTRKRGLQIRTEPS